MHLLKGVGNDGYVIEYADKGNVVYEIHTAMSSSDLSLVRGTKRKTAPDLAASSCHGTKLP